jgi:hypothetical protein
MKNRALFMFASALAVMALLMFGCQKSVDPETGLTDSDKAEIKSSIESDPLFTGDVNSLNDDGAGMTLGKTETPIFPRAWGRRITQVTRNVTYDNPNDSTVVATINVTITGNVIIRAKYQPTDTLSTFSKPFTESLTRIVKFYRNKFNIGPRWLGREVSAVKGGTVGSLVTITQVRVFMGTDTLTITDPLNYFLKLGKFGGREIPSLLASFLQPIRVQVSVTSADPDTDIVALHRPYLAMAAGMFKPLAVRMNMVSQTQTGGTYARVYEQSWTGLVPGRHHVFVSALTRSSIFDDVAAFSSQLWGMPYIVN